MIGGGETFATASFFDDTPDGHVRRRHLYHTDPERYYRMRYEQARVEHERLLYDRNLRNEEELRSVEHVRLFQATSTITVNPTLWTKVKIFGTRVKLFFKECFQQEPVGLIFATLLMCVILFIGIMKLFGA
jgi:hypothetical protein